MENRILEALVRHGEKIVLGLVATASVAIAVHEAIPDREIDDLLARHDRARAGIEAAVAASRASASAWTIPEPDLAGPVRRDWRDALPDGKRGPLAGLAFYLPPPIEVREGGEAGPAPVEPPLTPQGLHLVGADPEHLEIAWESVPGVTTYLVRRDDGKTWSVTATALTDREVAAGRRHAYTVASVRKDGPDGTIESAASGPLQAVVPESSAVEFLGYQEGNATATFRVRRFHEGAWYEKTFYNVAVDSRIGSERPVMTRAEGGGRGLYLALPSPYSFAGVESEEVPLLARRKEFQIRFGPGESDVAWATSLSDYKAAHPEHADSAEMARAVDGSYVSRIVAVPVPGVTVTRHRARLADRRDASGARRVVLDPPER